MTGLAGGSAAPAAALALVQRPAARGAVSGLVGGHLGEGSVQLVRDRLELFLLVHEVVCNGAGEASQRVSPDGPGVDASGVLADPHGQLDIPPAKQLIRNAAVELLGSNVCASSFTTASALALSVVMRQLSRSARVNMPEHRRTVQK